MSSTIRPGVIMGMGNPLLDLLAHTENDFLEKYDMKPNDAVLADEKHMPMYQEIVDNHSVEYIAGGATQNTMRIIQWLINVPNATTFFGCIGNDKFGKVLSDKAKDAGVNVKYQYTDEAPTGTCAVVITANGTQRSLCANLGAANCFKKDHLMKPENTELMKRADFLYISGFFLTVSPDSILEVGKYAKDSNKVFMLNLSAPFITQFFTEPLNDALPYADILFANEAEARAFAEICKYGTDKIDEIALKLCELPKENKKRSRLVVITQGSEPIYVACEGKVTVYPVDQLAPEEIVDTNGAGDAFVAGYISQLIKGKSTEECIRCANYAAREIIKRSGVTLPSKCDFK